MIHPVRRYVQSLGMDVPEPPWSSPGWWWFAGAQTIGSAEEKDVMETGPKPKRDYSYCPECDLLWKPDKELKLGARYKNRGEIPFISWIDNKKLCPKHDGE